MANILNVEFEAYGKRDSVKPKLNENELFFALDSKINSFFTKKNVEKSGWPKPSHKIILEMGKNYFKPSKSYLKSKSFYFSEGGSISFSSLKRETSTYDLHRAMRTQLKEYYKLGNNNKVFLDITKLDVSNQRRVLDGFVSLVKLSSWKMPSYGKKAKTTENSVNLKIYVNSSLKTTEIKSIFNTATSMSEATNLVRTLAEMPPNELDPDKYVALVKSRSKKLKYSFELINKTKLEKLGAGAFLAVARGSHNSNDGIVHLIWKPKRRPKKKIALVGKGICFDTGGYNVKTGGFMGGMRRDMTGSAIALSILEAAEKLNLPFEFHCFMGITENLIAPHAFRSDEVVVAMNGTTIEVINTDAEGRMILADTLHYSTKIKPDLIIDFATLTGSAVRAIGTRRGAIFSNNEKLGKAGYEAGIVSGERVWQFPVGEEFLEGLSSQKADILQCSTGGQCDHIFAATFLNHFVGDEIPWIHMDLSPDTNNGGLGLVGTETTGFGVRWGLELINQFFK